MSSSRTTAATDAPSIGWMLGMSSWMLLTLIPGPMLAWLGFSIIGGVSRSMRLIGLGLGAGALAIVVNLPLWGPWQPLASAILYLAGMLVALMVNPGWLRTMWERRSGSTASRADGGTWHRRTTTTPADRRPGQRTSSSKKSKSRAQRNAEARAKAAARADAAKEAAAKEAAAKEARAAEAATARTAATPSTDEARSLAAAAGASTDRYLASNPEPAEPVDVNTATLDQLMTLPGVNRTRARRALKQRDERGGFTSVEDFGEVAGLQPHEIVRLRRVATCSPRPRSERRFGRRVDY